MRLRSGFSPVPEASGVWISRRFTANTASAHLTPDQRAKNKAHVSKYEQEHLKVALEKDGKSATVGPQKKSDHRWKYISYCD